jgi:hypothetical protein
MARCVIRNCLSLWVHPKYLGRGETAVKSRVQEKTCQDYEGMLRRYVRPSLGDRVLASMRPMDVQTTYQRIIERGLSGRTIRYTPAVLRSALRQALQWADIQFAQ